MDELAHTNAAGCRHAKRYQDVEELLNVGIDVWTTVNVQHIESLTRVLFDTDKLLQKAETKSEAAAAAANQLVKLLNRSVIFYSENNGELAEPQIFPAPGKTAPEDCVSANEKATVAWTFRNNKRSGATTNTLSASNCLYLAVRVNDSVYGVFGIVIDKTPLDSFENSVVLSIIGELALALENLRNIKEGGRSGACEKRAAAGEPAALYFPRPAHAPYIYFRQRRYPCGGVRQH